MTENKAERVTTESRTLTPMDLLAQAQASGASLEQLEKFMDLQERHETREAEKAYNESMSLFRDECPTIAKTRKGHNTKYAGLAESINQVKGLMTKHGFSHSWRTTQSDDAKLISVACVMTHKLGHSETTALSAAPDTSGSKNSIQAIGSTVAYLQRYTLFAILGLASMEMDDDGAGSGDQVEVISEEQWAQLDTMIDQVNASKGDFCAYYGIKDITLLPVSKFKNAMSGLEAKRKKEK